MKTVRALLESLGLGEHASAFEENEIDLPSLRLLTGGDLKELGLTAMGPRKRLLAAVAALEAPEAPPAAPAHSTWPADLGPDQLPTFLAHPWRSLHEEVHPRVRLHWLVDLAELCVRWTVVIALADVVRAGDGRIPAQLLAQLRDHVERPTLGRWLSILRTLSGSQPSDALVPAVFQLHDHVFAARFRTEAQGASVDDSLLILRNQLAHGGGLSSLRAEALLRQHLPQLEALLRATVAATVDCEVVAADGLNGRRLQGCHPVALPLPAVLHGREDGIWLVARDAAASLMPLARFGPVRLVDADGVLRDQPGPPAAQLYARGERDRLSFTPVGRDEPQADALDVESLRTLFALDERPAGTRPTADGFAWDDQLREARVVAEDRVGRDREVATAKAWLKSRQPRTEGVERLGWISAGPGVGKSMLMAALAAAYANTPSARRGLYFHRFRGGDPRNSRRSFLRLLQAALLAWPPLVDRARPPATEALDGRALEEDVVSRLSGIAALSATNAREGAPSFWVFVDGLDEAAGSDRELASLLRRLAVPGTVWLIASRPEHGIPDELERPGCAAVFVDGLPPMSTEDLRAMLLQGLGNASIALVRRDEETAVGVTNAFVDSVAQRAHGLPLYAHLLVADLRGGRLTVHDESKLPDGLTAYYDLLLDRIGLSTVKRDLPLLVALLALAQEPLDEAGMALLLAGDVTEAPEYAPRVAEALRAGAALLRRIGGRDGGDGYMLYHQSFRDYVTGGGSGEPPAALAAVVREAGRALVRAADDWSALPNGLLRSHLFRWGTGYVLMPTI